MAKTYEAYKDSGVEWIGEIPEDWKVRPFKAIFKTGKGISFTKADLVKEGVPVISYGQVHSKQNKGSQIVDSLIRFIPKEMTLNSSFAKVHIGDFIFADTSEDLDGCGNCVYVDKEIGLYAGYHSVIAQAQSKSSNLYLAYLFLTNCWRSQIRSRVSGIKVFTISQSIINHTTVILPPISEQQSIASFLDKKCEEIDSLIALQEEMIVELQAYKQSVITEAVTKGLDPNAKMKDSGVEWIGEIPWDWEILPIRALFDKRNQKNDPIVSTERLSLSIEIGITRYADKTTNLDRFKDDFTAYQLAYPNDIVLNSMNMIVGAVGKSAFMGCVSPVYYVITAKEGVSPDFYSYLLNSLKIREVYHSLGRGIYAIERGNGKVNTCRLKVPYYDFAIINVPVPHHEEQIRIALFLNKKCEDIDSLISLKQEKIAELKDYKKSIIYEYVTGKKRV